MSHYDDETLGPEVVRRAAYDAGMKLEAEVKAGGRSEGAGDKRRRTPVVFVGGAMVGTPDNEAIVGDGLAVPEGRQRIAVWIKQGKIKIAGTGGLDALLVVKPEFDLHQHARFLLHGVLPVERDLQPVAPDAAYRRFPYKLDRHANPLFHSE